MQKESIEKAYRDIQAVIKSGNTDEFNRRSASIHEMEEVLATTEKIVANRQLRAKAEADITKLSIEELKQLNTLAASDELKRREKQAEDQNRIYEQSKKDYDALLKDLAKLEEEAELRKLSASEREIAIINAKYDAIAKRAKGHNDELREIERLREEELAAKRTEQEAKAKLEADKKEQERIKMEDEAYLASLSKNDKEIATEAAKWDALILKASQAGYDVTALREQQAIAIENIVKRQHDAELSAEDEKNKKLLDKQKVLSDNVYGLFTQMLELTATKNRQFADFQKGLALFQIGIDTASAISKAIATGSAVGLTPIEKAIAITGNIALVLANMAKARAVIESNSEAPRFAEGGMTSFSGGGPVASPRMGLIGERGPEWVAPNWMLNTPATANLIGMLENIRVSKYAEGGATAPGAGQAPDLVGMLSALNGAVMALLARLNQPIYGVWDYDYFTRSTTAINKVKEVGSIG